MKKEQLCQCLNNIKCVFHLKWQQLVCFFQPIRDSKQTTHKEQNSHSEGVSSVSNAASHPEESSGKKSSSPDVESSH